MAAPRVGTIIDGYKFNGGNHRDPSAWTPVGDAEEAGAKKFAEVLGARDAERLGGAMDGQASAYSNEATANRAIDLLRDDTPTGPGADARIGVGRVLGGVPLLPLLPGIPTRKQTANLEMLRNISSMGALGDVSKLKGPLSEKELGFIKQLQVDPNATRATNLNVAESQKWVARRQAAYGAAMQKWTQNLGSPSAANKDGDTFDSWWGRWSAEHLPAPGLERPKAATPVAGGLRVGEVRKGYVYKGGDPASPSSWAKQ